MGRRTHTRSHTNAPPTDRPRCSRRRVLTGVLGTTLAATTAVRAATGTPGTTARVDGDALADRVVEFLPGGRVWPLDTTYHAPTPTALRAFLNDNPVDTRAPNGDAYDCEEYAMALTVAADAAGLTTVGVVLDAGAAHAYNLVVYADADSGVALIEPQTDSVFDYDSVPAAALSAAVYEGEDALALV